MQVNIIRGVFTSYKVLMAFGIKPNFLLCVLPAAPLIALA